MATIKLKHSDNTFSVRHTTRNVVLQHVGRRGPQGEPGEGQTIYDSVPMFIVTVEDVLQLQHNTNYNRLSITSQGVDISGYAILRPSETGGYLVIPNGDTNDRPGVGDIGSMYFDTTLGKPIWFDGNFWVDATGANV